LASAHVEIWPVASGAITGLRHHEVVRLNTPRIELWLWDLYPSSTTYLQIYPGEQALGTVGERIEGGTLVLDQDKSEGRVIRLFHWLDQIKENGIYTLELIHVTPFGAERLAYRTFELDRTIRVNAMIMDMAKGEAPADSGEL
jgi:hypothetical protein